MKTKPLILVILLAVAAFSFSFSFMITTARADLGCTCCEIPCTQGACYGHIVGLGGGQYYCETQDPGECGWDPIKEEGCIHGCTTCIF